MAVSEMGEMGWWWLSQSYDQHYTKFWAFWKKQKFFETIFDKALMPFWKTFLWLKQLFNAKILFLDYTLSVFQILL